MPAPRAKPVRSSAPTNPSEGTISVRRSAANIAFGATRLQGSFSDSQRATVEKLMLEQIDFVDSPDFRRANALRRIMEDPPPVPRPDIRWYQPLLSDRLGAGSSHMLNAPRSVVLTAAQERVIFAQLNFARFCAAKVQRRFKREGLNAQLARELLGWFDRAEAIRAQIAETNLALVLSMAKRVRSAELDFGDLISEGNMALMRSVDKFDFSRGFKFSTYACRAILKAYSRLGIKTQRHRKVFPVEFDPELERANHASEVRVSREAEAVRDMTTLLAGNRAGLSDIERSVIFHRYGLDRPSDSSQLTLEQVGGILGVTKERVRQIQNKALEKLRFALIDDAPCSVPVTSFGRN
jgi:RNA polymerase sigma factor (sigma-70 family)